MPATQRPPPKLRRPPLPISATSRPPPTATRRPPPGRHLAKEYLNCDTLRVHPYSVTSLAQGASPCSLWFLTMFVSIGCPRCGERIVAEGGLQSQAAKLPAASFGTEAYVRGPKDLGPFPRTGARAPILGPGPKYLGPGPSFGAWAQGLLSRPVGGNSRRRRLL